MDNFLRDSDQTKCDLIKQNYRTDFTEKSFTQVNLFQYPFYNYGSLREYLFRQLGNLPKYGITDIIHEPSHWENPDYDETYLHWGIRNYGMSLVTMEKPTSDDCIDAIQKCFDRNPDAKVAVLSKAELSDLPGRLKERNLSTTRFSVEGGDFSVPNRLVKPAQMAGLEYTDFWLDLRAPKKEPHAPEDLIDLSQSNPGVDADAQDVNLDSGNPEEESEALDIRLRDVLEDLRLDLKNPEKRSKVLEVLLRVTSKDLQRDQGRSEKGSGGPDVLIHMKQCGVRSYQ